MSFLVRWKNKEDPIKNVDARAVTILSINFLDAQGELISKKVMGS